MTARFGPHLALDDVSIEVRAGEILCVVGHSGSGKSTLLRAIAGITLPQSGRISIDDVEVDGPRRRVEPEQRRVGMVFQDYALFPHLTVAANVAFGLRGRRRADIDRRVARLLASVRLEHHAGRYPHMLSGGERQRVALARALAPGPRVLLMDEPFSSLDDRLRARVREETLGLLRDTGTTTIVVTHDPSEAASIGDRIALLHRGRLVQCGTAEELYTRPTSIFAARFFSDVNELTGTCRLGCVETPLGCFEAGHLADQTAARVCIKPEHLRVSQRRTDVVARVRRSEFLGDVDRVTLDVDGLPTPLALTAFGRAKLEPGSAVYLEVEPSAVVVVADDER